MTNGNRINRRQFISRAAGTALGAISFPYIVPSSVLGQAGGVAPSNRITMGCIGVGWQGGSNLGSFLRERDCQIVAVCDVDKNHLANSVRKAGSSVKGYGDWREVVARDDIDIIRIPTPPHWRAQHPQARCRRAPRPGSVPGGRTRQWAAHHGLRQPAL